MEQGPLIRGRYQSTQLLGEGGLGIVYAGWDNELQRMVAIKRLRHLEDEGVAAQAWQEARTLAALQHPNIVTLYDFGEDEAGPYFVMELVNGETLDAILERNTLTAEDFVEVAKGALEGLVAAQEVGVVHRDLKPSNLMVLRDAAGSVRVKILDFGLAKFQHHPSLQTLHQHGSLLGSIYYIAPEQLEQRPLDGRTDLYALGCSLYHALAGRVPHAGLTVMEVAMGHLQRDPEPLVSLRPDLDPALATWVERLMMKVPDLRPASALEALRMLRALTGQEIGPGFRTPVVATGKSVNMILVGLVTVIVGVLVVAGGMVWWMGKDGAEHPTKETAVPSAPESGAAEKLAVGEATVEPTPNSVAPNKASDPDEFVRVDPLDKTALEAVVGRRVTVRGRLVGHGVNRTGTIRYLNFARNYREGLSLVFFSQDHPAPALENLVRWVGREVEVEGVVERFTGRDGTAQMQMKITDISVLREAGE